jgi:hypothetical protein
MQSLHFLLPANAAGTGRILGSTTGGNRMKIKSIQALRAYVTQNSGFSELTINSVIETLGFPLKGSKRVFSDLSAQFENCAEHGADIGIPGFIYYSETIPFFKFNREDIVNHMEQTAADLGTDIISMVQGFGVFRISGKPAPSEVGKALWDSGQQWDELTNLYNVFAWYALEEVSRTWYRYLEENPTVRAEIAA